LSKRARKWKSQTRAAGTALAHGAKAATLLRDFPRRLP
jgi:hypothetical protein